MWNHFSWATESFKHVVSRFCDALVFHIKDNIKFEDCTDEQVTTCILKMAANRYRDRRCRLHMHCNDLRGLSEVSIYEKFYQNKSGQFVTKEARKHHKKLLELREQMMRKVGSDSDAESQSICSMTDDAILDAVLGRQLGCEHSMHFSKKIYYSSSSDQSR
ncbi:uncharacterized protein [Elaeis guineensis]|uniref:uncharacterized protein isoform X2 n=1 Tax=Elaeis guineensis var. tenera TaxID=51953 RepID=UPI00094FAA84